MPYGAEVYHISRISLSDELQEPRSYTITLYELTLYHHLTMSNGELIIRSYWLTYIFIRHERYLICLSLYFEDGYVPR